MAVPFILDRSGPDPLHRQIYEQWRLGILAGRFQPRQRVPSTRGFATAYNVSRTTVSAAYEQLIAEGYFEAATGSGTFVCSELPDRTMRPPAALRRMPPQASRISGFARRLDTDPRVSPTVSGRLDLSRLGPDLERFPFALWRRLLTRHLRRLSPAHFDHFAAPGGTEALRRQIAAYVARARAVHCTPEQVVVVSGSQQGLDLCARVLLDPGDEALVEEPGYAGIRYLLSAHGAVTVPMPVLPDGASVRGISRIPRVLYVTPSHQFPTGVSMSLARRLELLDWARHHRVLILEDDYDSEYRYSGAPLPAMQSLAGDVPVVYLGTFSNVMFPGLRIGYLVLPEDLVAPFTRAKWLTDRYTPVLEQAALADFLGEGHLDRHIRRMRRIYKVRRDVLVSALARAFGDDVTIVGDAAGMHLTARFRGRTPAARAERQGVQLRSTASYYLAQPPANEFLFGFAAVGERTIREAVRRLSDR
ncbi:MAG TPA: PLP-dependent aminotransferase family protein [Vicinamibacterales bacterium]|jgi:GntR family transcriptional regulator/MocR family aminotransferase|nr:PLP-dependent aminotransferase family protein [Vicinamibacterales bacterium]